MSTADQLPILLKLNNFANSNLVAPARGVEPFLPLET